MVNTLVKAALMGLAGLAVAHPGHEEEEYMQAFAKREIAIQNRAALAACGSTLGFRDLEAQNVARRKAAFERLREERGIAADAPIKRNVKRSTVSVLNTDHEDTKVDATTASESESVFSSTSSVVLNPEGEVGPFYVLGEYVRTDLTEDESGVPIVLEAQFIDVSTCKPIVGAYWDAWNANATGVYSGVVQNGNGNAKDESNIDATFLRGIAETDSLGVANFSTLFPGHYGGRTTHIHAVVHLDATLEKNDTLAGGTVAHIGQFFWDQDLIDEVEKTQPYASNTIAQTLNKNDRVFGQQETQGSTSDPVFNYALFGDDVSDGIYCWIVVGIDTTATYTPTYSFELTADGGEAVSGGGGAGKPPGTF